MPQSYSEPLLKTPESSRERKAQYHIPNHLSQKSPDWAQALDSGSTQGHARGRSVSRPYQALGALQDVNEDEVLQVKTKSRKRSQSPVKKLLGFGKNNSNQGNAGERTTPVKRDEESPKKGRGRKGWGDKLKHGFLVLDFLDPSYPC